MDPLVESLLLLSVITENVCNRQLTYLMLSSPENSRDLLSAFTCDILHVGVNFITISFKIRDKLNY